MPVHLRGFAQSIVIVPACWLTSRSVKMLPTEDEFPPYSGVDTAGVQGNIFSLLVGGGVGEGTRGVNESLGDLSDGWWVKITWVLDVLVIFGLFFGGLSWCRCSGFEGQKQHTTLFLGGWQNLLAVVYLFSWGFTRVQGRDLHQGILT